METKKYACIREKLEDIEEKTLSKFASFSSKSKGRLRAEKESKVRTKYQKDRDKILNSLSFRLLKHKTQVFISTTGEIFRTRLTHTLEVAQVARIICQGLRLNIDLAEAIALGHDLGHTPFGHTGEEVLNELSKDGFKHSFQSLRVVDFLEDNGKGLNLTYEVRDGILKHSKGESSILDLYDKKGTLPTPDTLEGEVVQYSDWIAYINHDIDDAFHMGLIKREDLPRGIEEILGKNFYERIETILSDIIMNSYGKSEIRMSYEILDAVERLRVFLYKSVYVLPFIIKRENTSKKILYSLFDYYMKNVDKILEKNPFMENLDKERIVIDYIAGLSDKQAEEEYRRIKRK